jgi:4-carboxymuconolactone decarboxylase
MHITRSGSATAQPGPSATFTGSVRVTPLLDASDNLHAACASVSFEPGALSAWHTHPKGQLLIVTAGLLSLVESVNGKAVEWLEKVTDSEYNAGAAAASVSSAAPSEARKAFGDIAPALATYTDEVLFGDVWKRPGLSPRDRSLVTVSALVAGYRTNELPFHLKRALDHGVSNDELIEVITHLAFYSGWPTANTALPIARRVFDETTKEKK